MKIKRQAFRVKSLGILRTTEKASGYRVTLEAEIKDVEPTNGVASSTYVPDVGTLLIETDDETVEIRDCTLVIKMDDLAGVMTLACKPMHALPSGSVPILEDIVQNSLFVWATFTPHQARIFEDGENEVVAEVSDVTKAASKLASAAFAAVVNDEVKKKRKQA